MKTLIIMCSIIIWITSGGTTTFWFRMVVVNNGAFLRKDIWWVLLGAICGLIAPLLLGIFVLGIAIEAACTKIDWNKPLIDRSKQFVKKYGSQAEKDRMVPEKDE